MNKNLLKYSLSNFDLAKYLDNPHIVKYSEIKNYNSIDALFDGNMYIIVLIESSKNHGHWTCLLRYDNCIEIFDSYGGSIDHELKFISQKMRDKLGEKNKSLSDLLNKSKFKIITNNYKFQSEIEGIDTCGRWILARLLMFECGGMKAKEFENFIKSNAKKLNLTSDELVLKMIQF